MMLNIWLDEIILSNSACWAKNNYYIDEDSLNQSSKNFSSISYPKTRIEWKITRHKKIPGEYMNILSQQIEQFD